jgi:hypothetical protein
MLGLADIPSEVAVKEETAAIPVPDKVFNAMKRCTAAIIVVSVDEGHKDAKGNYTINENVLIEIGAAFVLYDKRVVLLWDRRLQVPSNLQGLYRSEYEGNDLNWGAGMKLMKAIKGFRTGLTPRCSRSAERRRHFGLRLSAQQFTSHPAIKRSTEYSTQGQSTISLKERYAEG